MNKKATVVGLKFGGITKSVCDAFRRLGWEAEYFHYDPPRRNIVARQWDKATGASGGLVTRSYNAALRDHVLPRVERDAVSLLLVLKGDRLDEDNLERLHRLKIPIIAWAYDSLERYPGQLSSAKAADHAFFIDEGDAAAAGKGGTWLPLGYDDAIYRPVRGYEDKDIDILLVGSLGAQYSARKRCLLDISGSPLVEEYACSFIGTTGTKLGDLAFRRKLRVNWLSRYISPELFAGYVARAKVCVNIHQDDGSAPVNPLFFAIPGAGTCQLAEAKPHLREWLDPTVDYCEFHDGGIVPALEQLLSGQDHIRTISAAACAKARENHTFTSRLAFITRFIR